MNSQKRIVSNRDLWEILYDLNAKHKITWLKVKGHSDNELNNECDKLATDEIKKNKQFCLWSQFVAEAKLSKEQQIVSMFLYIKLHLVGYG